MTQSTEDLRRSIEAAKQLRDQIVALALDDPQATQDTFDGETTLDAELRRAILAEDEDRIIIDGIKKREEELSERRRRAENRIEARRGLIEQAMSITGWSKHQMDVATISLGKAPARIEIDDEALIPSQFFKAQEPPEPKLDKAGLRAVLLERHEKLTAKLDAVAFEKLDQEYPAIPGVRLETGGVQLTVRRK